MFQGVDLVGQAQTGTGKTAAFGIPIAERVDGGQRHIQAIVLTPTRELAQQVSAEIARICKHRGIRVVTLYGGQPIKKQLAELEHGVHVVVGTPGRIIDHIDRGTIKLGQVSIVVLDEADLMLDYGFFPDIRRILRFIPGRRQIALFTATVPTPIKNLIHNYLHQPKHIQVGASAKPVEEVRQLYYEVADRDKIAGLMEVLHGGEHDQALIFCRTQGRVDMVAERLSRRGFAIQGIHGGMEQKNRDAAMNAFRDGSLKLLVATNVAARGLDIAAVSNVINFDIPESVEDYVHRIGRTARMGREGTAITFVSEWDMPAFEAIKKHVGAEKIERRDLKLYQR